MANWYDLPDASSISLKDTRMLPDNPAPRQPNPVTGASQIGLTPIDTGNNAVAARIRQRALEQSGGDEDFANLAVRIAKRESTFNERAVSPPHPKWGEARGSMQVIRDTFNRTGGKNWDDWQDLEQTGIRYLHNNWQRYGRDPTKTAASYHAGEGAVDRAGGVPNTRDQLGTRTSQYVLDVTGGATGAGGGRRAGSNVPRTIEGSVKWDAPPKPAGEQAKGRTWGEVGTDVGASLMSGFAAIPETVGNLYGLVTGDMDNPLSKAGAEARKWWQDKKSEYLKAAEEGRRAAVDAADGEVSKGVTAVKETVKNPALLSSFFAEQTPMTLAAGAGGVATGVAARAAGAGAGLAAGVATGGAVGTGAALQGADVGGDAYEELMRLPTDVWSQHPEYQSLTQGGMQDAEARHEVAMGLARQAGSMGGVISLFAQMLPGGRTIERALVGNLLAKKGGLAGRAIAGGRGAAGESFAEGTEEGGGALSKNLAIQDVDPSRSLTEGVGEATGLGALGGAGLGGVAGAMGRGPAPDAVPPEVAPGDGAPLEPDTPPASGPPLALPPPMSADAQPTEWEVLPPESDLPGPGGPAGPGLPPPGYEPPRLPPPSDRTSVLYADEQGNVQASRPEDRMADQARAGDMARQEGWLGGAVGRMEAQDAAERARMGLTPDVERAQSMRAEGPDVTGPQDILFDGKRPWMFRSGAEAAARKLGGEVVGVQGGYVVRPTPATKLPKADPIRAIVQQPGIAEELQAMAREAGWDQVGGRMIRRGGEDGTVQTESVSRTSWIPRAEWWSGMENRLPKDTAGDKTQEAVRKALAGEPLSAAERRVVEEMARVARGSLEDRQAGSADDSGLPTIDEMMAQESEAEAAAEREAIQRESDFLVENATDEELDALIPFAVDGEITNAELETALDQPEVDVPDARDEQQQRDPSGAGQAVANRAGQGRDDGSPQAGQDQAGDDFQLTGQTPEQVRQQQAAQERQKAERARKDAAPPPEEFRLTGSDSPADQARAAGQMELTGRAAEQQEMDAVAREVRAFAKRLGLKEFDERRWGGTLPDGDSFGMSLMKDKDGRPSLSFTREQDIEAKDDGSPGDSGTGRTVADVEKFLAKPRDRTPWKGSLGELSANAKPLYAARRLTAESAKRLIEWAHRNGFKSTLKPEDLHVTIAYSRDPVDAAAVEADAKGDTLRIEGGWRRIEQLGDKGAVVLKFGDYDLKRRWQQYRDAGASWDWEEYQPHITITYDGAGMDLSKVKRFVGPIQLGPEYTTDLDVDAAEKVDEVPAPSLAKRAEKAVEKKAESGATPEQLAAIAKYNLPPGTGFADGMGALGRGKMMAMADGQSSNLHATADAAAAELRQFLDGAQRGRERDAKIAKTSRIAAEKIRRGEQPTDAEWKTILDVRPGDTYARQPAASAFLTGYLGVSKANIKGGIGKAAGTVTSDSGAKYPIVYFKRLVDVFKAEPAAPAPTTGVSPYEIDLVPDPDGGAPRYDVFDTRVDGGLDPNSPVQSFSSKADAEAWVARALKGDVAPAPTVTQKAEAAVKKAPAKPKKAPPSRSQRGTAQTATEAFKRWFGGSKVVDEKGEPLRVYHGTAAEFDAFAPFSFFTGNAASARFYASKPGGHVVPVYLSLQNPARLDVLYPNRRSATERKLRSLQNKGHDGVIVDWGHDGTPMYIAFRPEQIKSATGNRGTFDPTDPDIRRSAPAGTATFSDQVRDRQPSALRRNIVGNLFGSRRVASPTRSQDDALYSLREAVEADAAARGLPRGAASGLSVHSVPHAARPIAAALKRLFGVEIVFVGGAGSLPADLGFDGMYADDGKTVFVAADSTKPFHQVIGHEFLHWLRDTNPEVYEGFVDAATPLLKSLRAAGNYSRARGLQYEGLGMPDDFVRRRQWEELYADTFGDAWADPAFWQQLAARMPRTALQRLADKLRLFILRVKMAVGLERANPLTADLYRDFDAAKTAVADAMAKAGPARGQGGGRVARSSREKDGLQPTGGKTRQRLKREGKMPASLVEAKGLLGQGWRVFVAHDLDEQPMEATSVEQLDAYTADQMLALPPENNVAPLEGARRIPSEADVQKWSRKQLVDWLESIDAEFRDPQPVPGIRVEQVDGSWIVAEGPVREVDPENPDQVFDTREDAEQLADELRFPDGDPLTEAEARETVLTILREQAQPAGGATVIKGRFTSRSQRTPGGAAPAAPTPQQQAGWQQRARDWFTRYTEVLGSLPDRKFYMSERYLAQGRIGEFERIGESIRKAFAKATPKDKGQLYEYFTTAGAKPELIDDLAMRKMAVDTKYNINLVGDKLEEVGLLGRDTKEDARQGKLFSTPKDARRFRDAYLPRLYLAHLLNEADWRAIGAGKKPSDMGYLRQRQDIPEEVRRVILGEIKDPAFLASMAILKPMRDVTLLAFLEKISGRESLVLQKSLLTFDGKKVTPLWLKAEADRLRNQSRYMEDRGDAAKAVKLAERMDAAADPVMEELRAGNHNDWKKLPDTHRYGRLRGLYVRQEVYDDIVGVYQLQPEDLKWYNPQSMFGFGGSGTKVTQWWKVGKVTLNPGSQVRNIVSNMVMLQLSGVSLHMVPVRVVEAIKQLADRKGAGYDIAMKYGVSEATFTSQELAEIKRDAIRLQLGTMSDHPLKRIMLLAGLLGAGVVEKAGNFHQRMEVVGKMAKIIDMKAKGATDENAALEAQKWLFDYSLVPQWVRYTRNAPIGSPFMTWMFKSAPRLAEVALLHPQRLLPWIGLMSSLPYLAALAVGGDDDDWKTMKELMPEWARKRSHVAALPMRDDAGRIQFVDLGPFMPWTMWWDVVHNVRRGEPVEAIQEFASSIFSGGPIGSLLAATTTGVDPFTDRPIVPAGERGGAAAAAWASYLWTLAMPPVITEQGFLGKGMKALDGTTNRYGDPRVTGGQAAATLFGLNMYGINPDTTFAMEMSRMSREMQDTRIRMMQQLQDRGISESRRKAVIEKYTAQLKEQADEARDYMQRAGTVSKELRVQTEPAR